LKGLVRLNKTGFRVTPSPASLKWRKEKEGEKREKTREERAKQKGV